MTAHPNAPVLRTFTRAELTELLAAEGYRFLMDGVYSRPGDNGGPATLAFDFDDPGDLALLIGLINRTMPPAFEIPWLTALDTGMPGHPSGDTVGLRGAWWRGFALAEPTGDQWADQISDCGLCQATDDGDRTPPDCVTHERAPWDTRPQPAGVA